MAKAVFRPTEVNMVGNRIILDPPHSFPGLEHLAPIEDIVEEIEEVDEYSGPTADDLRREADLFRDQWAQEKETMIRSAKAEADSIIKEAENAAFQDVKRKTDQAQSLKRQAEDEAEIILAEAREKAKQIEEDSLSAFENERKHAGEEGRLAGHEVGFNDGKAEAQRLVERMQTVLERAQDKRAEILTETEQQIIELVLLISRKVIKVISENQRNVVVSNVIQALRKVKGRGNIIIRVNMIDVKLTTEHTKEFLALVEGAKSLQVVEDTTVDPGGCVIETDFGEIDARIASQLNELETKILEIAPIRSRAKTASVSEGKV
jgi:flagellar assembly protein FliH